MQAAVRLDLHQLRAPRPARSTFARANDWTPYGDVWVGNLRDGIDWATPPARDRSLRQPAHLLSAVTMRLAVYCDYSYRRDGRRSVGGAGVRELPRGPAPTTSSR